MHGCNFSIEDTVQSRQSNPWHSTPCTVGSPRIHKYIFGVFLMSEMGNPQRDDQEFYIRTYTYVFHSNFFTPILLQFNGYWVGSKVFITCRFNYKILDDHFLVHEGCVIMMFYVPQESKSGHPKFSTGDKYFNMWAFFTDSNRITKPPRKIDLNTFPFFVSLYMWPCSK